MNNLYKTVPRNFANTYILSLSSSTPILFSYHTIFSIIHINIVFLRWDSLLNSGFPFLFYSMRKHVLRVILEKKKQKLPQNNFLQFHLFNFSPKLPSLMRNGFTQFICFSSFSPSTFPPCFSSTLILDSYSVLSVCEYRESKFTTTFRPVSSWAIRVWYCRA